MGQEVTFLQMELVVEGTTSTVTTRGTPGIGIPTIETNTFPLVSITATRSSTSGRPATSPPTSILTVTSSAILTQVKT